MIRSMIFVLAIAISVVAIGTGACKVAGCACKKYEVGSTSYSCKCGDGYYNHKP
jgi:hypothetical protein